MKGNTVFKRTYNDCLSLLQTQALGPWTVSEVALSEQLGASRTTVRGVLAGMVAAGILQLNGPARALQRHPVGTDFFPEPQTESVSAVVERKFMQMVLCGDFRPGQMVSTAELARQFGASTTAVREYLTRFSQFGLLERRANTAWIFKGVSAEFAAEIHDIREMFELRSARRFAELDDAAPAWQALNRIEQRHRWLLDRFDQRHSQFSQLDEAFHQLVLEASSNRFIRSFYEIISFVFHYHYQWDRTDEKERNLVALHEHLDYIAALRSRDHLAIERSCRVHMRSARRTLLRSITIMNVASQDVLSSDPVLEG